MKYRTGFVSNSSTTSFCICGTTVSEDEAEEVCYGKNGRKEGLEAYYPPYDDNAYIGMSIFQMNYDETLRQFETRVKEILVRLLGREVECKLYRDAWRDE